MRILFLQSVLVSVSDSEIWLYLREYYWSFLIFYLDKLLIEPSFTLMYYEQIGVGFFALLWILFISRENNWNIFTINHLQKIMDIINLWLLWGNSAWAFILIVKDFMELAELITEINWHMIWMLYVCYWETDFTNIVTFLLLCRCIEVSEYTEVTEKATAHFSHLFPWDVYIAPFIVMAFHIDVCCSSTNTKLLHSWNTSHWLVCLIMHIYLFCWC